MLDPEQRLVTVCDACHCASCWQGYFMCELSLDASTTERTVAQLRELGREHERYWQPEGGEHD